MLIGWVQLASPLLNQSICREEWLRLWLARLGSQAPPQKDGTGRTTVLGTTHHTPSKILAAVLQQVL